MYKFKNLSSVMAVTIFTISNFSNAMQIKSTINTSEQISAKQICLSMLRAELFPKAQAQLCYKLASAKVQSQKIEEIMVDLTSLQLTTPDAYQKSKESGKYAKELMSLTQNAGTEICMKLVKDNFLSKSRLANCINQLPDQLSNSPTTLAIKTFLKSR